MENSINSNVATSWDRPDHFCNLIYSMSPWKKIIDSNAHYCKQRNGKLLHDEGVQIYRAVILDFGVESDDDYVLQYRGEGLISIGRYSDAQAICKKIDMSALNRGTEEFLIPKGQGSLCLWYEGVAGALLEAKLIKKSDLIATHILWSHKYIEYLKSLDIKIIRTMNFQRTNFDCSGTFQENESSIEDISFSEGVPHDALCILSKQTQLELHICIPTRFDEKAAKQLGDLYSRIYPSNTKLHIEYSNENWNHGAAFKSNNSWSKVSRNKMIKCSVTTSGEVYIKGHGMSSGDKVLCFSTYEQSLRINSDADFLTWEINTGTELVVEVISEGFIKLSRNGMVVLPFKQNEIYLVQDYELKVEHEIKKASDIISSFCNGLEGSGVETNRIYSTQNANPSISYPKIAEYRDKFDSIAVAPYFDTSILQAQALTSKGATDDIIQFSMSVFSSKRDSNNGSPIKICALITAEKTLSDEICAADIISGDVRGRLVHRNISAKDASIVFFKIFSYELSNVDKNYQIYICTDEENSCVLRYEYNSYTANIGTVENITESFKQRFLRERKQIKSVLSTFKQHKINADESGLDLMMYEGGFHNFYSMPCDVTRYMSKYYESPYCEMALWNYRDSIEHIGASIFSFYKEGSTIKTSCKDISLFGLSNFSGENHNKDARYRFYSGT